MGKVKQRTRKPFRGGRKKMSKVRKPKLQACQTETKSKATGNAEISENQNESLSASAKKLKIFGVEMDDNTSQTEEHPEDSDVNMMDMDLDNSYFIAQENSVSKLISSLLCPTCGSSGITFKLVPEIKYGFAAKAMISCKTCDNFSDSNLMCQRVGNSQSPNVPFDINIRSTLAFRGIGSGFSSMKEWASMMNMPCVLSQNAYIMHNNKLEQGSMDTFRVMSETTDKAIFKAYKDVGVEPDEDGILNIAVSYDGAWQKRGYSSHNGVASVIDLLTGMPVDFEVLSNFCSKCDGKGDADAEWKEKHASSCSKNYDGSAGSMEVECALRIWGRSVDQHKFRYTTMLCDGDSKAYDDAICQSKVYGNDIVIDKEDCINHVSKRMGTALRNLASVSKAQKDSITGKGKLTQIKIKKIQNYYGKAIKTYSSDVKLLKTRVMGILLHLSSTDKQPKHAACPPGETSWCFWQRALAKSQDPGTHKDHETLPVEIGKKLVPIFQRLSDEQLLQRCSRNMTQNANESLHHLVWKICPKATYVGRRTMQTAMALAICQFTMGASFKVLLCKVLKLVPGKTLEVASRKKDLKRLRHAEKSVSESSKKRRKHLKYNRLKKDDEKKSTEGETYSAGAFNA